MASLYYKNQKLAGTDDNEYSFEKSAEGFIVTPKNESPQEIKLIDSSLSDTSTNAIQNKVVTAELNKKLEDGDLNTIRTNISTHTSDSTIHISQEERELWNAKLDSSTPIIFGDSTNSTWEQETVKGTDPYNSTYYYTNITIDTDAELTEGSLMALLPTTAVASSYRNARVRFGEDSEWIPICGGAGTVLAASSYLSANAVRLFVYSKSYINTGAFHLVTDSNSDVQMRIYRTALSAGGTYDDNYPILVSRTKDSAVAEGSYASVYAQIASDTSKVAYINPTTGEITAPNYIGKVNGFDVNSDVPEDAVFTDTTYENKSAVADGTDVSLVTTGEKATWNAKQNAISDLDAIRSGAALGATAVQTETDPTVPDWAKQATKPSYEASEIGENGVAELDENGYILSSQLPSFVDDVVEFDNLSSFPETGEAGKIYVDISKNITYRWSGTTYVSIGSDLALGETSSTAYAGNKGKANADAIAELQSTIEGLPSSYAPVDAQANVIESVKINGVAQTISDKAVDITVDEELDDESANPIQNKAVVEGLSKKVIELTKAEYEALTDAERNNGSIYCVVDEDYVIPSGGGGGNATFNEMTMAQYEALSPEQQTNGELYLIKDADISGIEITSVLTDDVSTVPSNKAVSDALKNGGLDGDFVFCETDTDEEFEGYVSDNINNRVANLETTALHVGLSGADKGETPMTSADLLGGEYSADTIRDMLFDLQNGIKFVNGKWFEEVPNDYIHNARIRAFHYEGHDVTEYKLPYPHVDVVVFGNTRRGIAIAVQWAYHGATMWICASHDTWGDWVEYPSWSAIKQPLGIGFNGNRHVGLVYLNTSGVLVRANYILNFENGEARLNFADKGITDVTSIISVFGWAQDTALACNVLDASAANYKINIILLRM